VGGHVLSPRSVAINGDIACGGGVLGVIYY
jgi:hypothetical protein